jgi:hypothetical protein
MPAIAQQEHKPASVIGLDDPLDTDATRPRFALFATPTRAAATDNQLPAILADGARIVSQRQPCPAIVLYDVKGGIELAGLPETPRHPSGPWRAILARLTVPSRWTFLERQGGYSLLEDLEPLIHFARHFARRTADDLASLARYHIDNDEITLREFVVHSL